MTPDETIDAERRRFRRTLLRVLIVQAAALLLLWLLQARYGSA
jgi:predicted nucleic acid-binding Zn ribbon protein